MNNEIMLTTYSKNKNLFRAVLSKMIINVSLYNQNNYLNTLVFKFPLLKSVTHFMSASLFFSDDFLYT